MADTDASLQMTKAKFKAILTIYSYYIIYSCYTIYSY